MTYIFVFLGEFGYELFNWQGVVRRFRRLNPEARVICCSRGGVSSMYDDAYYIDLRELDAFQSSVAIGYYGLEPGDLVLTSDANVERDRVLRAAISKFVRAKLRSDLPAKRSARWLARTNWIFSSSVTVIDECRFGADRRLFGNIQPEGDIYELLDLRNNFFTKLSPSSSVRPSLEERLGFSLDEPYVLIQGRQRDIARRSTRPLPQQEMVESLASEMRVVALDFSTGRANDSFSRLNEADPATRISISTFAEQSALIEASHANVFLSVGDFGSHIYVPPFIGRDVHAVAPRDVFDLGTTPIEFWNKYVFRFGGQIIPVTGEELNDAQSREEFARVVTSLAST